MKIQFFYDAGHTYTAANVSSYSKNEDDTAIIYHTHAFNHDIETNAQHVVPTDDLLFAIVTPSFYNDDQVTTIIHGHASKFSIEIAATQLHELISASHQEALQENKRRDNRAVEEAKYRARKKARITSEEEFMSSALAVAKKSSYK